MSPKRFVLVGIIFTVILIFSVGGLFLYLFFSDFGIGQPIKVSSEGQAYTADWQDLINRLNEGEKELLIPTSMDSPMEIINDYVGWTSEDYMIVAGIAFEQYMGYPPSDDWTITYIRYIYNCEGIADGPTSADIWFSRFITENRQRSQLNVSINIEPLYDYIYVNFEQFTNIGPDWIGYKFGQIPISGDAVLAFAEAGGGYDTRMSFDNDCHILESIQPNTRYRIKGWKVDYSNYPNSTQTESATYTIDAISGEVLDIHYFSNP